MFQAIRTVLTPARLRVAALLAVMCVVLLLPLPRASRAVHAIYDLGHGPLFGVAALMLFHWSRQRWPGHDVSTAFFVWSGLAVLGIALEGAQDYFGRHGSWHDAVANMLGSAAFLMWALTWDRPRRLVRLAGLAVGVACLVASWRRPLFHLADAIAQYREMPLIDSFEHEREFSRWHWSPQNCDVQWTSEFASDGRRSMRLNLRPAKYPSAELYWPVSDWSPYQALTFDVFLTGDTPLPLVVKIEDDEHNGDVEDRFHAHILLKPGLNSPRIRLWDVAVAPHERVLDLRRIKRVQFYTVNLQEPRVLYLDNLRLQP